MKIEDSISYTLAESSQFLKISVYELHGYIKANRIAVNHTGLSLRVPGKEIKKLLGELKNIIK